MATARPPTTADSERRLARVQAISGLVFLVFVLVHLVNLMLAAGSPGAYDGFQRAVRPVYQFLPFELGLVMAPLLVHVVAGVRRLRRSAAPRDWRGRLHRASGIFLLVVIFGHIAAVRGSSVVFGAFPEFAGLELSMWLAPWFFYPYYGLFAVAAVYHGLHGAGVALATLGVRVPRVARDGLGFWTPAVAGMVLALAGILGIGGWLYTLPDPTGTDAARLAERFLGHLAWPR